MYSKGDFLAFSLTQCRVRVDKSFHCWENPQKYFIHNEDARNECLAYPRKLKFIAITSKMLCLFTFNNTDIFFLLLF